MDTISTNVNLDEYTLYILNPTGQYIVLDRNEKDRFTSFFEAGLDQAPETEIVKGKILSFDPIRKTYDIKSDFLFEFCVKDLQTTMVSMGYGLIR